MHVLMLPSWYPDHEGEVHGSFFREQAETLADAGHRVGVLAIATVSLTDKRALRAIISRPFTCTAERGVTVARGLAVRPLPMARLFNARAVARRWEYYFERYMELHGLPDILHAHAMNPGGVAAARIARRHGLSFVVTEHRAVSAISEMESGALAVMLRGVAGEAAECIAVSPGFASEFAAIYGGVPWHTIPNLLPQQFEKAELTPSVGGPFVFGHVSNLGPGKRIPLLLEAFALSFGDDPAVQLRIAGDSYYRAELEQRAAALGLRNVSFVGAIPRSDIAAEFARYDAFVMPSSAESFGVVFWEALACGLPIVATATDGGGYAVSAETGLLAAVDNCEELAAQLKKMRATAGGYDREAIRRISIEKCGIETFTRRYADVYRDASSQVR